MPYNVGTSYSLKTTIKNNKEYENYIKKYEEYLNFEIGRAHV